MVKKKMKLTKKNKTKKNKTKTTKSKESYFYSNSRLTKLQRKYCHCLMKIRPSIYKRINSQKKVSNKSTNESTNESTKHTSSKKIEQPREYTSGATYAICYNNMIKYNKKIGKKSKGVGFVPRKTNCLMNYKLDRYDLEEIKVFAKEKNIPTYKVSKVTGKRKPLSKKNLIRRLENVGIKDKIRNEESKRKSSSKSRNSKKKITMKRKFKRKSNRKSNRKSK